MEEDLFKVPGDYKDKGMKIGLSSDDDDDDSLDDDDEESIWGPDPVELEEDSEPLEFLNGYGVPATDEEILGWMSSSDRPSEEKEKKILIVKLRRYFKSLQLSQGYKCTYFPGQVCGVTSTEPRYQVIKERDRYPEGYNLLVLMASVAIGEYNTKSDSEYKVKAVEDATVVMSRNAVYKITFTACGGIEPLLFRAKVGLSHFPVEITVFSCVPEQYEDGSAEKEEIEGDSPEMEQCMKPNTHPAEQYEDGSVEKEEFEGDSPDMEQYMKPNTHPAEQYEDGSVEKEEFEGDSPEMEQHTKPNTHPAVSFLRGYGTEDEWLRPISILQAQSDVMLLDFMKEDQRYAKMDESKLAKKIKKYLDSVIRSKGFECTRFSVHIPGLAMMKSRHRIINNPDRFTESKYHFRLMASLAIDDYYKNDETNKFQFNSLESVNSFGDIHYITFIGHHEDEDNFERQRFQAVVRDGVTCMDLLMCRIAGKLLDEFYLENV